MVSKIVTPILLDVTLISRLPPNVQRSLIENGIDLEGVYGNETVETQSSKTNTITTTSLPIHVTNLSHHKNTSTSLVTVPATGTSAVIRYPPTIDSRVFAQLPAEVKETLIVNGVRIRSDNNDNGNTSEQTNREVHRNKDTSSSTSTTNLMTEMSNKNISTSNFTSAHELFRKENLLTMNAKSGNGGVTQTSTTPATNSTSRPDLTSRSMVFGTATSAFTSASYGLPSAKEKPSLPILERQDTIRGSVARPLRPTTDVTTSQSVDTSATTSTPNSLARIPK